MAAFAAPSARAKMMVATPRDSPFGPYERRTFLIWPTVVLKYSYEKNVGLVFEVCNGAFRKQIDRMKDDESVA